MDGLYTSEPEVYRRHILTYKDGPRAGRVNLYIAKDNSIRFLFVLLGGQIIENEMCSNIRMQIFNLK